MKRRLYFLFPYEHQAKRVVDELLASGTETRNIHALAREGTKLPSLPPATLRQKHDLSHRLEHWLWNGNLTLFFIALIGLFITVPQGMVGWPFVLVAIMAATFVIGLLFTVKVPNTHVNDLHSALAHGEVLLMVDVPKNRVKDIEDLVHKHHPEAAVAGVGWTLGTAGL